MSRGRRRRTRAADLMGLAGLVVAAGVIGVGGWAAWSLRPPPTDAQTLCRLDQPPGAHTLVLIDASDKLSAAAAKRAKALIDAERSILKAGDRFTLMTLDAQDGSDPRVVLSLCDPGGATGVNALWGNPEKSLARWQTAFDGPFDRATQRAIRARPADTSPLIEASSAAGSDPLFMANQDGQVRRMIVISDFLHHEPGIFTQYDASGDEWARFQQTSLAHRPFPDLSGVEVRLFLVARDGREDVQGEPLRAFWRHWYQAAGAEARFTDEGG
jgi:hypothetical protein